jgi:3-methylcrotonyl-CoA carboxylase alpha subunit
MEMNTRLQVEHTVTEAVTGLDLVEWQLRVASGEALPLSQSQVAFRGHAVEARVCAEDPERDFLPSSGHLGLLSWPQGEAVRVDAGFDSGDDVPSHYDSLLGKIIAWAPTRGQAAARLASALDSTYCAGVRTNERWLARILRDARFLSVRHSVAFLQQAGSELTACVEPCRGAVILAGLVAWQARRGAGPWESADGFTPNLPGTVGFTFAWRDRRHELELRFGSNRAAIVDSADPVPLADISVTANQVAARLGNLLLRAHYWLEDASVHLWLGAQHFDLLLDDPRNREYANSAAGGGLTTPLPGVVVAVLVAPGQPVAAGQALLVVEAMKMEHTLTAPHAGTVKALHCAPGDRVPEGKALLELTAA